MSKMRTAIHATTGSTTKSSLLRVELAVVISLLAVAGGCRSGHYWPWPFQPQGTMHHQQSDAIVHDPYPMPDIAPDDNATRPRDFQNPLPEPVRNRIVPSSQIWTAR